MDDKDRQIEELERKVAHLGAALKSIDRDVASAAKKYLRCNAGGVLDFAEFLDLLSAEVKEYVRGGNQSQAAMKAELREIVRERLEQETAALLPTLKGRLSDYVTLQIVILEKTHQMQGHLLVKTEPFWKALSVHGEMGHSLGRTPEEAWAEMRKQIACKLFSAGPENMVRQLSIRDFELHKRFEAGRSFVTDELEGFKIEVRLVEKAPKA